MLDPSGFLMGRGADTSMLLLMSICSTLDTSMGVSVGGRREGVVVGTSGKGGPRDQPSSPSAFKGLTGVLGLPRSLRGERDFGSKVNFSLMFSSTDGAMYVKPRKTWLALSLSVESSGLSTGV